MRARRYAVVPTPLTRLAFWRLVLDEAQLAGGATKAAEMARYIKARHRWAITGVRRRMLLERGAVSSAAAAGGCSLVCLLCREACLFTALPALLLLTPLLCAMHGVPARAHACRCCCCCPGTPISHGGAADVRGLLKFLGADAAVRTDRQWGSMHGSDVGEWHSRSPKTRLHATLCRHARASCRLACA
jgi:hypothetical protein